MQVQITLENERLPIQDARTPWRGICCSRCYRAKSDKKRCRCRCHGQHHGEQQLRVSEKACEQLDQIAEKEGL